MRQVTCVRVMRVLFCKALAGPQRNSTTVAVDMQARMLCTHVQASHVCASD